MGNEAFGHVGSSGDFILMLRERENEYFYSQAVKFIWQSAVKKHCQIDGETEAGLGEAISAAGNDEQAFLPNRRKITNIP